MAKKSKNKAPKRKSPQSWTFNDTQATLLQEQGRIHQQELQPLLQYQANTRNQLLRTFIRELGIGPEINVTADLENMKFVEQVD